MEVREMYACVCQAVPMTDVELAVITDSLTSVEEVGEATYAGTGCGACHETIEGIIDLVGCPLAALRRTA
jgi:NAD(P)H-nitrite reductase large subunit